MTTFGDDGNEMPRPGPFDDDAIDALLAGTSRAPDDAAMSSFIDDLRTAAAAVPNPSPALAAAIAAGGISTTQPRVAQWRTFKMKIKGFVAGLGVAGKLALGVGVAAAATTGAGAAGVLPGAVQHAVSQAVRAVSPFTFSDGGHHSHATGSTAAAGTTTTSVDDDVTSTTAPGAPVGGDDKGKHHGGVVTPTTVAGQPGSGAVTTTTLAPVDGGHEGDGPGNGDTNPGTTPTTLPNGDGDGGHHGDGDSNNPQAITLDCQAVAGATQITCTWTASPNADHAQYVLLRTGDGDGRVIVESADALSFTDTSVSPGTTYKYLVDSLRADNSVDAHSNRVEVSSAGGTTPTTEHHDDTTITSVPGDGTTPTTEHH